MLDNDPERILATLWSLAQLEKGLEDYYVKSGKIFARRKRKVYAILDCARHRKIYHRLLQFKGLHCCLYIGDVPPALREVAPFLLQLDPDAFARWLLKDGWGDSWGIFAISTEPLEVMQRHFRRFLKVQDHTGQQMYFRFYDPRVLRAYLPTCTPEEIKTFFGPIERYVLEKEDRVMRQFFCEEDRLIAEDVEWARA